MKHLYSVKNIHFVFGINVKQLEISVKSAYGFGIDAKDYLQKFFNIVNLPQKSVYNKPTRVEMYANKILPDKFIQNIKSYILRYLIMKNPSNRKLEHLADSINLICNEKISYTMNIYLVFLVCLKIFDEEIYNDILNQKITAQQILSTITMFSPGREGELNWLIEFLNGTKLSQLGIDSNLSIHQHFICWENVIED